MTVRLSAKLPQGDANGTEPLAEAWDRDPSSTHVAVVLLDCSSQVTNTDTHARVHNARIQAIEAVPLESGDGEAAHQLWWKARCRRTGAVELPLEQ